jgi:hypothetical protein
VTLFGNGLKANVTRSGRLVNLTGSPVHHLAGALSRSGTASTRLDAEAAVRTAKRSAGETSSVQGPDDTV